MSNKKVLYHFMSDDLQHEVYEIKNLHVQSDNPSDIYQWYYHNKKEDKLLPLSFSSMKENYREFKEASLLFDDTKGVFKLLHGTEISLQRDI